MFEMDSALPPHSAPLLISVISPNSSSSSSSDTQEDVTHGFDHLHAENFNNASVASRELRVTCFSMVLILWLFVSANMILGVYRPKNVWIGPNSSILVEPNFIFVQNIKVKELDDSRSGLQLLGFYRSPPLDVLVNWSESRFSSLSYKSYKEWPYYLNKGTTLNISFSVKPEDSPVQLVVNEGTQGVSERMFEAAYRDTAYSSNLITGSGMIELEISKSSSYYVAVVNLNTKDVKVELDMDVRAVVYDTKQGSFYNCNFSDGECTFTAVSFLSSVVLTSSGPSQGGASIEDEWYIKISYKPRWIAYIAVTSLVICFMLGCLQLCKRLQSDYEYDLAGSQRTSLLANKDDEDSSNESFAADDADLEEFKGDGTEASKSIRHLCAICFDSSRDCFFLPCGHCVSCYQCGTKVEEADGSCPICRRKIKKVKRIFTV